MIDHAHLTDHFGGLVAASLADWKPRELAGEDSRARMTALATRFPSHMSRFWGYECRLNETRQEADLLICVGATPEQATILSRLATERQGHPVWSRIALLANRLMAPDSPLLNAWFEFDLVDAEDTVPSLFFGSNALRQARSDSAGQLPAQYTWLAETLSELKGEKDLAESLKCHISRVINALPGNASIFQVGVMTSRKSLPIRLCIQDLSEDDAELFLVGIGCDPGVVKELLQHLLRADSVRFAFDVSETGVTPRLGMECYFKTEVDKLQAFINFLMSRQHCTIENAGALLAWYGVTHERRYPDCWPQSLKSGVQSSGSIIHRYVNHIKLTLAPDSTLEAKAYLAARLGTIADTDLKVISDRIRVGAEGSVSRQNVESGDWFGKYDSNTIHV